MGQHAIKKAALVINAHLLCQRLQLLPLVGAAGDADGAQAAVLAQIAAGARHLGCEGGAGQACG